MLITHSDPKLPEHPDSKLPEHPDSKLQAALEPRSELQAQNLLVAKNPGFEGSALLRSPLPPESGVSSVLRYSAPSPRPRE